MAEDDLQARLAAWVAEDPDDRDVAELTALSREDSPQAGADLADRFAGRLEFGTAGLRGRVGGGPNRMNRAVVRATTAALAGWLLAHGGDGMPEAVTAGDEPASAGPAGAASVAQAGVVIGCDARHRSDEFAAEAAGVLAAAGIRVHLLPPRQPTPLLAFAIRHLRAAAGIMITASHNPPADNGYKLYLSDGAQIIPPADAEIEAAIRTLGPLSAVPVVPPDSPLITRHGSEVADAYLDAVCAASPAPPGAAWLRFVYTPLHGVAGGLALRAFEQAGFPAPDLVAAQAEPDPDFPTVAYPNPEEPGTLDIALAQARRSDADLLIASDPDGDRLAAAVPDPKADGGWRVLTGDQVGALLGAYLLGRQTGESDPARRLVATTVVSSTLLSRIAAAAGAQYAETLTGFKWIVRAAERRPGASFTFGYEEALGYAVGDIVRDKDGIGAALALLGLAALARSGGESLLDAYDALESAHGVHLTSQLTAASTVPLQVMARLRASGQDRLGDELVASVTDLTGGTAELPSADVLSYRLRGGRVVIRPSGTEPKIKAYLEVVEPVLGGRLDAARQAAQARMDPLRDAVRQLLGS